MVDPLGLRMKALDGHVVLGGAGRERRTRVVATADGLVEEHLSDVRFVPLVEGVPDDGVGLNGGPLLRSEGLA